MSKLLALEWDAHEARIVSARTRGKDVVVEEAFTVALGPRDPGETFADPDVGARIASALAARDIGRCDALLAVGRSSIELRNLQVPPSPPEELPDLVRFQAMREFSAIGEDWPLDFVHVDTGQNEESLTVLAAAISSELLQQLTDTCQAADVVPQHIVLRPFAAASLLGRQNRDDGRCRLMVDVLQSEADLTVLVDGNVVLMRTVR